MQILVVEDDPTNSRVMKDMLQSAGAEMDAAADAETGLRMIDEGDYNVILMDIRMPGMDGLTAIRELRGKANSPNAALPVIVVTADAAVDLRQQCMAAGANEVIPKPVAMGTLLSTIGRMAAQACGDNIILN